MTSPISAPSRERAVYQPAGSVLTHSPEITQPPLAPDTGKVARDIVGAPDFIALAQKAEQARLERLSAVRSILGEIIEKRRRFESLILDPNKPGTVYRLTKGPLVEGRPPGYWGMGDRTISERF